MFGENQRSAISHRLHDAGAIDCDDAHREHEGSEKTLTRNQLKTVQERHVAGDL
jgi:hypothetical protein